MLVFLNYIFKKLDTKNLKGTVSVISSDPPCKDGNAENTQNTNKQIKNIPKMDI